MCLMYRESDNECKGEWDVELHDPKRYSGDGNQEQKSSGLSQSNTPIV